MTIPYSSPAFHGRVSMVYAVPSGYPKDVSIEEEPSEKEELEKIAWAFLLFPVNGIHAHRWRHTLATDLLSKGVPVSEVAAILGNSARIVEKHYSQWIESRQTALEEAVKRTWTTG